MGREIFGMVIFFASLILIWNVQGLEGGVSEEYYASVRRLEQCADNMDLVARANKIFMNYKGNNQYTLTFNISLDMDLDRPLDMKFEVKKCQSETGPCEDFVNHTIADVCTELESKNSIPSNFFGMAQLPNKCPLLKGVYIAEKSEIKVHQDLLDLGRYGNYWKLKVFLMKGPKTPVLCLYTEGKVAKVSKTKKRKRN